ncbi:MAG: hypothetical protein EOP86_00745 [Verrucomicrobiaceae bacterium]|nr:MAG: hypothetical protein EOP86_00745 [Verrucomicrobiaceae bacterium]
MTKTRFITAGGFAFLGVLTAWQFLQIQDLKESNNALARQVKLVPAEKLPTVRPASQIAKADVAKRAEAKESTEPAAARPEDAERAAREARFQEMRQMDRAQRHDARVLALTTKLNLSPEQQNAVREALQKGSADRDAVREAGDARRRDGAQDTDETRRADMAKIAAIDAAQEENIAATMSGDQVTAYADYKNEQKQVTVENRANQMLGDLQNRFSLTDEQKDAAFQYFAKQEQESGFDPVQIVAQGGDPMALMEQMQKERLEALKQILTPEQFALHSAQEAQRAEMFRSMQPGGTGGAPAPRANP